MLGVPFKSIFLTGAKAAFSSNRSIFVMVCKTISATSVPGEGFGASSEPIIAAKLKRGGGFLNVTLKYFPVVAEKLSVCCTIPPAGIKVTCLK